MAINGDMALINRRIRVLPSPHHTTHELGGSDQVNLDASQIVSGVLNEERIPHTLNNQLKINNLLLTNKLKLLQNEIVDSQGTTRIQFDVNNNKVIIPSSSIDVDSLLIGGTQVIDSSRNIKNVLSIDMNGSPPSWNAISLSGDVVDVRIMKKKLSGNHNYLWIDAYADSGYYATVGFFRGQVDGTPRVQIHDGSGNYNPTITMWAKSGTVDMKNLQIGGTTVIDSSRNINNVNEVRASSFRVSDDETVFSASINTLGIIAPYSVNYLAFLTPYKTIQDGNDVTNTYDWIKITNMRGDEYIDLGVKSSDGSEVSTILELYYDLGGGYCYPHFLAITVAHTDYIRSVKVEASSTSDFSSDVATLLDKSNLSKHIWDGTTVFPINPNIGNRRYVKITMVLSTSNTSFTIKLRQVMLGAYYLAYSYTKNFPFDWDNNKNLNLDAGLQIQSTTIIDSSRKLQNVNIDRDTTDLPPSKILEDTTEHSLYNPGSSPEVTQTIESTYIDSVVGFKQIRVFVEGKCDAGVGWALEVYDDNNNKLASFSGTNTSYEEKDSGWVNLIAQTKKLRLVLVAMYDSLTSTADTSYVRNIRVYAR